MIFLGWLLVGTGLLMLYAAVRNLSVLCIVTGVVNGRSADCTNK